MSLPPRTYDTMSDAIAMSSPSGRMSKRQRKATEEKLKRDLFGPDGLIPTKRPERSALEYIEHRIATLRKFMPPKKGRKKYEREIAKLEAEREAIRHG